MTMIEVRAAELTGAALDWAVAMAVGHALCEDAIQGDHILIGHGDGDLRPFRPSTDWAQGGPLIYEHDVALFSTADDRWHALHEQSMGRGGSYIDCYDRDADGSGATPLIAAMRALVASKLGDVVSVPAKLMQPTTGDEP